MVGYITKAEAARMLNIPPDDIDEIDIHRCPGGYHIDAVKNYASTHKLPIGNWYNIIALSHASAPLNDQRVVWCESVMELLWRASVRTRAIILPHEDEEVWSFIKETPGAPRLIIVGDDSDLCHISINGWNKAIEVGCQKM